MYYVKDVYRSIEVHVSVKGSLKSGSRPGPDTRLMEYQDVEIELDSRRVIRRCRLEGMRAPESEFYQDSGIV